MTEIVDTLFGNNFDDGKGEALQNGFTEEQFNKFTECTCGNYIMDHSIFWKTMAEFRDTEVWTEEQESSIKALLRDGFFLGPLLWRDRFRELYNERNEEMDREDKQLLHYCMDIAKEKCTEEEWDNVTNFLKGLAVGFASEFKEKAKEMLDEISENKQ